MFLLKMFDRIHQWNYMVMNFFVKTILYYIYDYMIHTKDHLNMVIFSKKIKASKIPSCAWEAE